jgi:Fatty acid hydroxylase superfamily
MFLLFHLVRSLFCAYMSAAFMEYFAHRWLMHRQRIARFFGSSVLLKLFHEHIEHHFQCFDIYDHEEGPCGIKNLSIRLTTELLAVSVPALLWFHFDWWVTVELPFVAILHGILWSAVHTEMHRPLKTWFSRSFIFQYINRHHFLHHRHPGTNFGALFLGWDWILLTRARATEEDLQEIRQQTYMVRPKRVSAELLERSRLAREARERA